MKTISRISVTSKKPVSKTNPDLQVLKDSLTATEKKILIHMLNAGLSQGQVKNKVFHISKTGDNTAEVVVGTVTKSILLGKKEIVKSKMTIKYS